MVSGSLPPLLEKPCEGGALLGEDVFHPDTASHEAEAWSLGRAGVGYAVKGATVRNLLAVHASRGCGLCFTACRLAR